MENKHIALKKVTLASLPVLFEALNLPRAFILGALICLGYWVTRLFFRFTHFFFPKNLIVFSFILWILTLAQCGFYLGSLKPWWVASVVLLVGGERLFKENIFSKLEFSMVREGAGLWILISGLGFLQQVLSRQWGWRLLEHPAGALFVLGLSAMVLQKTETKRS